MPQGMVTVLENQIDAETNTRANCRYIKIVATFGCFFTICSLTCGWFWNEQAQELTERTRQCSALEIENAKQGESIEHHKWLWTSHELLISLTEDDPSLLTRNDEHAWKAFLKSCGKSRMEGFIKIVNDGDHPRLAAWHAEYR